MACSSCDNQGMPVAHKIVFVVGITIMVAADALQILFGEMTPGMLYMQAFMLLVPAIALGVQKFAKK
jgi:hypothetical protein